MELKPEFKIVVVGPSDVDEERQVLVEVVEDLNRMAKCVDPPFTLELRQWRADARPGVDPLSAQRLIDERLDIDHCDLLIAIFAGRFGAPVYDADSGTVHEIQRALRAHRENGAPDVLVYFDEAARSVRTAAEADQLAKLIAFKEELIATGTVLVWPYQGIEQFRREVRFHVWEPSTSLAKRFVANANPGLRIKARAEPVVVRGEGYTELTGDIVLELAGHLEGADERTEPTTIFVYFQNAVTSRLRAQEANVSDPREGFAIDAFLYGGGEPHARALIQGKLIAHNALKFGPVELAAPVHGHPNIYRISGVRVNAMPYSRREPGETARIRAMVKGGGIAVENSVQTVAISRRGLQFEVLDAGGSGPLGQQGYVLRAREGQNMLRIATLRFSEGFPMAFKGRFSDSFPVDAGPCGWVYPGESPALMPALTDAEGCPYSLGIADFGTRVQAVFSNVPTGVRLYVSAQSIRMPATICLGNSSAGAVRGAEIVEVPLRNWGPEAGSLADGMATWEIQAPLGRREQVSVAEFGVFISCEPGSVVQTPWWAPSTLVRGTLAPVPSDGEFNVSTGGLAAKPSCPVPRFSELSPFRPLEGRLQIRTILTIGE